MKKIGVIGFGNLGRAFVTGLLKSRLYSKGEIIVCAKSEETLSYARRQAGVFATDDVRQVISECEFLFLSVKKNVFLELLPSIDQTELAGKTIVSFMAGMRIEEIQQVLGAGMEIVRAMPTLAIAEANGIIAYTPARDEELLALYRALGFAFETEEGDIEKVTVYSACGLGFAAYLIDAYIQSGVALGFDPLTSSRIAEMNFSSAIKRSDYETTMREVATKGGLTEYGFAHMTTNGVKNNIVAAVESTYRRIMGEPENPAQAAK